MKKEKLKPVAIVSREGMRAVVAKVVKDKLKVASINIEMEKEIAEIQKRYQAKLDPLNREIQMSEAGLVLWAEKNKSEFGDLKSIDLPMARIGFRTSPPAVEKTSTKDTWLQIAMRLATYMEGDIVGENYVRYADPVVDKEGIIADRSTLPESMLKAVGLKISQEENFYIAPKSEVLEPSNREVSA